MHLPSWSQNEMVFQNILSQGLLLVTRSFIYNRYKRFVGSLYLLFISEPFRGNEKLEIYMVRKTSTTKKPTISNEINPHFCLIMKTKLLNKPKSFKLNLT